MITMRCLDNIKNYFLSWVIVFFCILIEVYIMQVCPFINTHWMVHIRFVHLMLCKFCYKQPNKQSEYWALVNDMHVEVFRGNRYWCLQTYFEMHQKIIGIDGQIKGWSGTAESRWWLYEHSLHSSSSFSV